MPSIQSFLLNRMLRRRVKAVEMHKAPIDKMRSDFEKYGPERPVVGTTRNGFEKDGLHGEWHTPKWSSSESCILYLHGGGYIVGSPKSARPIAGGLARETRTNVFAFDYRLAPEHPFPAAVDDAVSAYNMLLGSGYAASQIAIMGDSAGGGLTAATLLALKAAGTSQPACAVLFSPWADLSREAEAYIELEPTDVMFRADYLPEMAQRYIGAESAQNPLISPVFGDFEGAPPTLIFASEQEILYLDAIDLEATMKRNGVVVELRSERGLAHVWPAFYPHLPEARRTLRQTAQYLKGKLGAP